MLPKSLHILVTIAAFAVNAQAQNVTGTILIKKKLTRQSVTPSIPVYQRGTAVKLGKDTETDPFAYERSRVIIYLESPTPVTSNPVPPAPIQMQQMDRRFSPDLIVIPIGATISFPNMDPIFHNVFSLSKPRSFDLGSYDQGETRNVTFSKPGIVEVYCHLHPNMAATIVVAPSRWFAHVDRSGQFRIPDVPPGQYTVVAWHKSAGFFRKSIVIEPGRDAVADFFIPIDLDTPLDTPVKTAGMGGR
jgi:plastocyanin